MSTVVLLCLAASAIGQTSPEFVRQFPIGKLNRLDELPASGLRARLGQLPPAAQERALQWLRSIHFTDHDLVSLHADSEGGVFYVCSPGLTARTPAAAETPPVAAASVPLSPFPAALIFHSRPGAPNVLYLNFTGETVTNTQWNTELGRTSIPALAFSSDSDYSTFNDAEQVFVREVWQRVAEDYAPFNIDVTTERPSTITTRTAMALITRHTDLNGNPNPSDTAGGVAYVNVFATISYAKYRPAWIYYDNLQNVESYVAEATSHEIGHNFGLSHDGQTDGTDYYLGHGSGDTSWAPIMGAGYYVNVSQWSKGDYYLANNAQDDLATIAAKISYRTDDHGNTLTSATPLVLSGSTNVVSTSPESDPANANTANKGVLERNTDIDVFSFVSGSGPVSLAANPWIMTSGTRGGNLDILLELHDAAGNLLMTNNPANTTSALIQTNLSPGSYYLYVRNTGAGDPFNSTPTGYTVYGGIGQYFISGYITDSADFNPPPLAAAQLSDLTQTSQTTKQVTVTYSDDGAVDVSTVDSSDVRVTGPNGYDQLAQIVSLDPAGNGTPRTATYSITPPSGGSWLPVHNGTYTVFMRSNQVSDTQGAYVSAGQLGRFQVSVPVPIYAAHMDANPGWTLDPQWQYGPPAYVGIGPTSGFTGSNIIAYNLNGNYSNSLATKYTTTPSINCSGNTVVTLRFKRWLRTRQGDTASIQVSTDGATWTNVWSSSGTVADSSWQTVQYTLPAGIAVSPSVRLRWGQASNPALNEIGWNIDDVELLGDGTVDSSPPMPALAVANLTLGGSPSHSCSVTYSDSTAVRLASLDSTDLVVTGPNAYSNLVEFIGADLPADGSPVTGTYSIPAPGGTWDANDNGTYVLTLLDGAVEDTLNNAAAQTTLGSFNVAISTNPQDMLGVLPADGLNSSGTAGGPFTPSSITYTLTNSGGSPLNWSASKSQTWESLSTTEGTLAASAATNVMVSINTNANALAPGNYSDAVNFLNTTSGNGNTTRSINFTVNSVGVLAVLPTNDLLSSGIEGGPFAPSSQSYMLTNSGGSTLTWAASKGAEWLSLSATAGVLSPGASTNVTVSLNATANNLAPGDYLDLVSFQDLTSPLPPSVPKPASLNRSVSLTVRPVSILAVLPTGSLNATGAPGGAFTPDHFNCTLTNTGSSSFDWSASVTVAWLVPFPAAGNLSPGASTNVSVSFNAVAATLPAGNYTGGVSFTNLSTGKGNTNLTANLTVSLTPTFTFTAAANNTSWGMISPSNGSYLAGTSLELRATPAMFFRFAEWGRDASGTDNPTTLLLDADKYVAVIFAEILTTNHPTPYWWLAAHGVTNDFETAVTDVGANGMPLWESYVAGLDPHNPASRFLLSGRPTSDGTSYVLNWNPVAGRLYSIWAATDLFDDFTPLPGASNLPATMQSFTNAIAPAVTPLLYRLEVRFP